MMKYIKPILFITLLIPYLAFPKGIAIYDLKCEYFDNPEAISQLKPRLSWKLASSNRNVIQTYYEIRVAAEIKNLDDDNKASWYSGKIKSDQSINVSYKGGILDSGKKYYWKVRIWDNKGNASGWSDVKYWRMGILDTTEWKAKWITVIEKDKQRPSPMLRKEITLTKKIKSAIAYITALGLYEAYINGEKIGDSYFTPGWTSYGKRLQYQAYDVTSLLKAGENAIGTILGDGWYRGTLARKGRTDFYGKELGFFFQMEIEYTDGSKDRIISDESWKYSFGPILSSSIYHGETYDSRLEETNWNTTDFTKDAAWSHVNLLHSTKWNLVTTLSPSVRKKEEFKSLKVITTPKGEKVIDFGQNLIGWVRVKAQGEAGTKITINHAEVLDKEGNFYTANLRSAKQENTYILKGNEIEEFEPHFSFQGFRYIKISGYPGEINPENFIAVALYSDMQATGQFNTSNPLINQLQSNIQWGQKGNFLDVPTDCPQRDERLGWTGDAQAFFNTAAFNMNVAGFFRKWLQDLKADQRSDGHVPEVIPNFYGNSSFSAAGWGDAATIIPWQFYVAYADTLILQEQYESMKAWVGYIQKESVNNLWVKVERHYGDWLFFSPSDDLFGKAAVTDRALIAQAFYAYSVQNIVHTARVLGYTEDEVKYTVLLQKVKDAFVKEYTTETGKLTSNTQTAYVLALHFNLLPEHIRQQAAERLADNIKTYGHITTGFLGTPYICHVLSRFGYTDIAYELLIRDKYPSWLYPITKGATTIWERWDGIRPDGSFQNVAMNSFNHYAYGAIGDWMYRKIAGINSDVTQPGYKHIVISPEIGGGLTSAMASLETLYGTVKSEWKIIGKEIELNIQIPVNTTATVHLPFSPKKEVLESGNSLKNHKYINVVGERKLSLGSGNYMFKYFIQ